MTSYNKKKGEDRNLALPQLEELLRRACPQVLRGRLPRHAARGSTRNSHTT